jgi:hypothetical protein
VLSQAQRSRHQRHLLRDRRPSTAVCPACWAMGKNQVKYVMSGEEKKLIFTGPTREAKAGQKNKPNEPTNEGSFHIYLWSFHSPQFQQSAGATPKILSGQHQTLLLTRGRQCFIIATRPHHVSSLRHIVQNREKARACKPGYVFLA